MYFSVGFFLYQVRQCERTASCRQNYRSKAKVFTTCLWTALHGWWSTSKRLWRK